MSSFCVGLGDGIPAAQLLSTSLCREYLEARTIAELPTLVGNQPESVIVSGGSGLSIQEIAWVATWATKRSVSLSFVNGWAEGDALRHAIKIAEYTLGSSRQLAFWSNEPLRGLLPGHFGDLEIIGTADCALVERITQPSRVLALATHGNGVAAALHDGLLRTDGESGPQPGPYPRSAYGAALPLFVDPCAIASDVTVLATCYGLLAKGSAFHPAQSIAAELSRSRWSGVILTTYREIVDAGWLALYALGLLADGHQLGEVCLRLNEQALATGEPFPPWILLGDPALSVADSSVAATPRMSEYTGRFRPGVNLLQLPSPEPHVVTSVEGPASDHLSLRQVPHARSLIAVHQSSTAAGLRLEVIPAHKHASFAALEGMRRATTALQFAIDLVNDIAEDPRSRDLVADGDLKAQLSATRRRLVRVAKTESPTTLAARLTGMRADVLVQDVLAWKALNRSLVLLLAAYAERVGPSECLPIDVGVPLGPMECVHCGMPAARRSRQDPGSGAMRVVQWCMGCAFTSSAPADVRCASLAGPQAILPGAEETFTLGFDCPASDTWRVMHACLRLQRAPWPTTTMGPVREVEIAAGDRPPKVELSLTTRRDVPKGRYFLIALVAMQTDTWIYRRPVWIGTAGGDPLALPESLGLPPGSIQS